MNKKASKEPSADRRVVDAMASLPIGDVKHNQGEIDADNEHGELIRLRLEVETLRLNRKHYEEHSLELEAKIATLSATEFLRHDLAEQLLPLTADEIELIELVLKKMNGEGRKEYGNLEHDTDNRSISDWAAMQLDEFIDTAFYSLGKRARQARGLV